MLVDLTYNSREVNRKINALVGDPYGVFSKKRWSGIGSERFIVSNAGGQLAEVFGGKFKQNFANIELRPNGLIIHIRYRLDLFALVIPYWQLTLFKNLPGEVNIYGDGEQLTLKNYHGRSINNRFIQKIVKAKAGYYQEHHVN